jgi:hypothetical protein
VAKATRSREAVTDEAVRLLFTDILVSASTRKHPDRSPEHDEQFDHSPSWGGPSARVASAEGLIAIGFYVPETLAQLLPLIERLLTEDPAPEVRFQISTRLHLLLEARTDWVWAQARRLVAQEQKIGG